MLALVTAHGARRVGSIVAAYGAAYTNERTLELTKVMENARLNRLTRSSDTTQSSSSCPNSG